MTRVLDEPDLVVLARVIDRGSFARAAAELNVPPSTLSRRVAALEKRLGVRALERTTRHLRATEVGEMLAARGRRVREELEDAERVVADHRSTPRGLLRVALPTPAGSFLGAVFAAVLARYPELRIEIGVSDAPLAMLAEGYDVALQVGAMRAATTYGVLRLGHMGPVIAASPRYLERVPPIRHPRDFTDPAHTIIARTRRSRWELVHGKSGKLLTITPATPRVVVTAKSMAAELVAAGVGIAFVPRAVALASSELQILEPAGYRPAGGNVALVMPSARTSAPKVRAFVDAMKAFVAARTDIFT